MARGQVVSYVEDLDEEMRAQRCEPDERIFLRPDCHPASGFWPMYDKGMGALCFICVVCRREWGPRVVIAHDPKRAN